MPIKSRDFIALFMPFLCVFLPMYFLYTSDKSYYGIPISAIWIFLCIPLTYIFLFIASRKEK